MEPVRIYYENERSESRMNPIKKTDNGHYLKDSEQQIRKTEKSRPEAEEDIILFPETLLKKTEAVCEMEAHYNIDRTAFLAVDYREPEILPIAEKFQESLDEIRRFIKTSFDQSNSESEKAELYLNILNLVCKDCYEIEEKVSKHAKFMMEAFPDDDCLCEDMEDITEDCLNFYLKAYHTMMKCKRKTVK